MTLQLSKNIHCQDFQKLRSVGRRGEKCQKNCGHYDDRKSRIFNIGHFGILTFWIFDIFVFRHFGT